MLQSSRVSGNVISGCVLLFSRDSPDGTLKKWTLTLKKRSRNKVDLFKSRAVGPWLWLCWQSSRFRHQKSADRIPTPATFFQIYLCQLLVNSEKTKINRKRGREWPIKKSSVKRCPGRGGGGEPVIFWFLIIFSP